MNFSRRQFVKGGVTAFTFGFAAPQMLCDIAFAQGVPSRNLVVVYLSGGNDSLSTVIPYRDPFYASRRPTLAIPAGNVLQIGTRFVERRARPASAADRPASRSSMPAASRSCSAPATPTRAARTSPASTSGAPRARSNTSGTGWLGRYLDQLPPPIDPLVAWNTNARNAAAADGAHGRRAGDHQPGDLCVLEPEQRRRGRLRAHRADAHLVAHPRRSAAPRVRELDDAGGAGHARSRGDRGDLSAGADLSEQRLRAGAAGRRRRDEQADRHEGVLGADRRLRHARAAGRQRGRLRQPDGDARRRAEGVLRRPERAGHAEQHRRCSSTRSSAAASARTAARAPTTAPAAT